MATQDELQRQNIPTLYDETWQKIFYLRPEILDNLRATHQMTSGFLGQLEYYSLDTDGSFSTSMGGGDGNFISKAFFRSIPRPHRPRIYFLEERLQVLYSHGRPFTAIGHIMLPILFTDTIGGDLFRIKLWLFVVEDLPVPVFLASHSWVTGIRSRARSYTFEFDNGKEVRVKGLPDPTFRSFGKYSCLLVF